MALNPVSTKSGEAWKLSRLALPRGETLPETPYQMVHDDAMLDANARLDLAMRSIHRKRLNARLGNAANLVGWIAALRCWPRSSSLR